MEIEVLKAPEAIRRRPGMYVGDTRDGSGLHYMLYAVVDNAVDEAAAGPCDRIDVALNAGGSATVRDNGRGIPTEPFRDTGVPTAEVVMTELFCGARVEGGARDRPGRLRGVGLVAVNALSDALDLRIWRNCREHFIRFRRGEPEAPLAVVGDAGLHDGKPRRGTEITFLPDAEIFASTAFDFATIEHRLRGLAGLNAGVTVTLVDKRGVEKKEVVLRI
jgi:DNA gyrase subunit B